MISLKKNFLFIHAPKTGGNSIQTVLKGYSEDRVVAIGQHQDGVERFEVRSDQYPTHKHSTLREYKSMLEPALFNNLYKFAVIRNPWDMMISWYFSPHRGVRDWKRGEFVGLIDEVQPLRHYIRSSALLTPTNLAGDLDFLLRFERLDEDFEKLCEEIRIPWVPLPIRNRSCRAHYSQYYDEDLVERVRGKFSEEIEFGRYVFECA
jgi:hypothetical protein